MKLDIQKEVERRFLLQEEYLGIKKQINKVEPLVSVSVATYQHVDFIKECLDGILLQKTNFEFEILLGDDESTDGTREICINYAEKFPDKIRLFLRDRKISHLIDGNGNTIKRLNGVSGFNIMAARGKYIALCEGDDYWTDPLKLQKQVDLMDQYVNTSMCVALNTRFNIKSGEEITDKRYSGDNFPLIYFENLTTYFHTSTYLIRKKTLDLIVNKYRDLMLGDTSLRFLLINEGPFVVLNDVVSVYRITGSGVWTSIDDYSKDLLHYNLFNKFRKYHVRNRKRDYAKFEIKYLFNLICYSLKNKNFKSFVSNMKSFLKLLEL
jgi:glycosyltransferase involved in cell wall biosynthesis